MHEVGIMQSALDIAVRQACRQGATRIIRIGMRIGALSGVVPDALEFAFGALKRRTLAANATLEVEIVPLRLHCAACERDFEAAEFAYACPGCGAIETEVRGGRELDVAWLELETDDNGGEQRDETGSDPMDR